MREEGRRRARWAWSHVGRKLPSVPAPRQDLNFYVKIKLLGPELMALELTSPRASRPGDHERQLGSWSSPLFSQHELARPESLPTSVPHLAHKTPISSHRRMGCRGVDRRPYREMIPDTPT